MGKAEAIQLLSQMAGSTLQHKSTKKMETERKLPIMTKAVVKQHNDSIERMDRVPQALIGRALLLEDLYTLAIATDAKAQHAALLLTNGQFETGRKVRRANGNPRYILTHETPGEGMAWFSPGFELYDELILIEGEINAMSIYLSHVEFGIIGASSSSNVHRFPLRNKTIFLITDNDKAGQGYQTRWANEAYKAGAKTVRPLFSDRLFGENLDANDYLVRFGRDALRRLLDE